MGSDHKRKIFIKETLPDRDFTTGDYWPMLSVVIFEKHVSRVIREEYAYFII